MYLKGLTLDPKEVGFEHRQALQEGLDLSGLERDFDLLTRQDGSGFSQSRAEALLDEVMNREPKPGYPFIEPSSWTGIVSQWGEPVQMPPKPNLLDRLKGAWLGRSIGCLLGKPAEGWLTETLHTILKRSGNWPLRRYMRWDEMTPDLIREFELDTRWKAQFFADRVRGMPVDDDLNYTVLAWLIVKEHGRAFTPQDVATMWMGRLPLLQTFTAERAAYRSLSLGMDPPSTASYRNPYREWIGAQIRTDFYGYISPGRPDQAAEMGFKDACISHTKNGIYGALWVAAMLATGLCVDDTVEAVENGLRAVPQKSRFAESVGGVLAAYRSGRSEEEVLQEIHSCWDESNKHDWCHAIPNAMIVAFAALWSRGDYGGAIGRAVQAGFDTDCNGATVGSLVGAIIGEAEIPEAWKEPIGTTLHSSIVGLPTLDLHDLALAALKLAEEV